MKRFRCISVLFLAFSLLTSCAKTEESTQGYAFYFCQKTYEYGSDSSIIAAEYFSAETAMTPEQLIEQYLLGPQDESLSSPFPSGTTLHYLKIGAETTEITLSPQFASLEKIELTIACACLTLTISSVCNCTSVEISALDSLINNQKTITMDVNALALYDIVTAKSDQ